MVLGLVGRIFKGGDSQHVLFYMILIVQDRPMVARLVYLIIVTG